MELSEIIRKRVVYSMPGMEQSIVRSNTIYKSDDGLDLKMDTYYPRNFAYNSQLPAVIFIHGDGPPEIIKNVKDWGQYATWGQLIAATGLIGITFNRRSAEGKLTKMVEVANDVKDLINYVRFHADELWVNRNALCIWACSAGVPYLQVVMENPPNYVRCLVAYYGMMDFQQFIETLPTNMLREERETTIGIFRMFSLLHHMTNTSGYVPPMLVAQAGLDAPAINETINRFVEGATQEGKEVAFFRHVDGHHGFDVLDDDESSRSIIKQTLTFIRDHLSIQSNDAKQAG
jgi:dipeptidyl aminopeptidase/acylaminoacyl peptidase